MYRFLVKTASLTIIIHITRLTFCIITGVTCRTVQCEPSRARITINTIGIASVYNNLFINHRPHHHTYADIKTNKKMKKILSLLFVLALCVSGTMAQEHVQNKENAPRPEVRMADTAFTFDDIQFWAGEGDNEAAIVIQWADENTPNAIVWGYRWNGEATGLDLAVAVAKADPRLVLLTQYTGSMGNTICGFGYGEEPFTVIYGGEEDQATADKAIEEGMKTGVIEHPFNAETCGTPSYDYDSWTAEGATFTLAIGCAKM